MGDEARRENPDWKLCSRFPAGMTTKESKDNGKSRFPAGMTTKESKDNGKSRFPAGMTTRKAKAKAEADSLRE